MHINRTKPISCAVGLLLALSGIALAQSPVPRHALLLDPTRPSWSVRAPATVTADVETSVGTFTLELIRDWAPRGVDRFYNLARGGYYDDSRFYRVIAGFIAQFGIAGDPAVARAWSQRRLPADPMRERNVRGTIAFAQYKPTDRATNVFINLRDNPELDTLRFAPIGRVVKGVEVVDSLYAYYGEFPAADEPLGNPKRLAKESNRYLDEKFPKLDRVIRVTVRPDTLHGQRKVP